MPYAEALFVSVQDGEVRVLMTLLSKDPSRVNNRDETGQTLLHVACALGNLDIMIHLLNQLNCEMMIQENIYGYTALHMACLYDQPRIVTELLKRTHSRPEFVNLKDKYGWTALHHAARNGHLEICQLLIHNEAKPSLSNELGKTACHYAAQHGHLGVLTYLYDYVVTLVTPPVLTTDQECDTCTLLHCAAINAHSSVVQWLKTKTFSPVAKSKRLVDYHHDLRIVQYPDEVAESRGHTVLRVSLLAYRQMYQDWINDIAKNNITLDRIKLCICGFPRVGKSAMRQSLSRPFLLSLLGKNVEETNEDNVDCATVGIEITSMQLSGRDLFSVWDFAGQIDNFITHQFFISTQSTVFTVLINLTNSPYEQKNQLMRWLGFIKMRNLGQIPLCNGLLEIEREAVPMNVDAEFFTQELQLVPVIIVGSHYDQISPHHQKEAISSVQTLINEMRIKFKEYLDISPQLFPLNCLRAVSPEITHLKEHLCEVRGNLIQVQPKYPRVVELIARKTECLRVEQPRLKVMTWENMRSLVREKVNYLLSDRQLAFVLKCLTNVGVLVYLEQGALTRFIFIDPGWLCQDVLGKALAPESFPVLKIASIGSAQISEEDLRKKFVEHIDKNDFPVIISMLQYFDLCYRQHGNSMILVFPVFIKHPLDQNLWKPNEKFSHYSGRQLISTEETDMFPPGFFSRLQVLISRALKQNTVYHFKDCFLVEASMYQCLVQITKLGTAISIIGRTGKADTVACMGLMDLIQGQVAVLVKDFCPTLFTNLMIPSSSDLKLHYPHPHYYHIHEIVDGKSVMINPITKATETISDLLYMGNEEYHRTHAGKLTKIAYIPDEIIQSLQELLQDGEADWKDLARAIGLEKYVQLLDGRSPESTRLLLLKWGEKSKWTVNSLLFALRQINRMDVCNYIRARF